MKTNDRRLPTFFLLFFFIPSLFSQKDSSDFFQNRMPAIGSTVPDAFGKGYFGTIGIGAALQQRTRLSGKSFDPDGNAILAIGLGHPAKLVGVDFRVNLYGFHSNKGAPGNFGESTVDVHLSRAIIGPWLWAGIGGYDLAGWVSDPNNPNNLDSYYACMTAVFPLNFYNGRSFSTFYLTVGAGNGRFRTDENYTLEKRSPVGFFGSAALQILPEGNFTVEWTGYNLFSGISLFPFKKLPGQILLGVDDIFHEKRRLVLSGSLGFHLFKRWYTDPLRKKCFPSPPPPQTSRV